MRFLPKPETLVRQRENALHIAKLSVTHGLNAWEHKFLKDIALLKKRSPAQQAKLDELSDRFQIAFPLLSDPESKTIDAYHIRNNAAKGNAVGVPEPGTFILDQEGVIRAKLFLEGFRERHSTEELIKAAKAVN